ncbi:hypothetical protein [Sinomicrobium weinanense]|uniref:Uncharacterized protein n=1 Tax=Sinomicrobium weinanense TaxID=2842200 RepID=A0A926JR59_9FLAO|nr:hypothetical protein [Sinomicrobium weinanense]MBC9795980.1 hypothetical protein [Sinomicrobium weinanense]MBU3122099.1 hypothetical protein [Sinomicrobium weinanense]
MKYHKKDREGDFRVPEDYFDTLEDRIMQTVLREGKLPQKDGFEIPPDYMDQVEGRIMTVLETQDKHKNTPAPRKKTPVYTLRDIAYAISAAAAAVVILTTVFHADLSSPERNNTNTMVNLAPEDIEFYMENDMLPLYGQDITEMLDTTDLNAISFSTLEDEEVISYLEEHLTDYSDLNFDN